MSNMIIKLVYTFRLFLKILIEQLLILSIIIKPITINLNPDRIYPNAEDRRLDFLVLFFIFLIILSILEFSI